MDFFSLKALIGRCDNENTGPIRTLAQQTAQWDAIRNYCQKLNINYGELERERQRTQWRAPHARVTTRATRDTQKRGGNAAAT
jgi:hypothetical protein